MRSFGHLFIASALLLSACGGAEDGFDQDFDSDGRWSTLIAADVNAAPDITASPLSLSWTPHHIGINGVNKSVRVKNDGVQTLTVVASS